MGFAVMSVLNHRFHAVVLLLVVVVVGCWDQAKGSRDEAEALVGLEVFKAIAVALKISL